MLQLRLEPMRIVVAIDKVWLFLEAYMSRKGRPLSVVAMAAGVHELFLLWRPGVVVPHLEPKELKRLERAAGLTSGLLTHLAESPDELSREEADAVACVYIRRDGAEPGPGDIPSILGVIRNPSPEARSVEMSECKTCDTPYPGNGRCPECHRVR